MLAPWLTDEEVRAEIIAFGLAASLATYRLRPVGRGGISASAGWLDIRCTRAADDSPGRAARALLDRVAELAGEAERCDHPVSFEIVVPEVGERRLIQPVPELAG